MLHDDLLSCDLNYYSYFYFYYAMRNDLIIPTILRACEKKSNDWDGFISFCSILFDNLLYSHYHSRSASFYQNLNQLASPRSFLHANLPESKPSLCRTYQYSDLYALKGKHFVAIEALRYYQNGLVLLG